MHFFSHIFEWHLICVLSFKYMQVCTAELKKCLMKFVSENWQDCITDPWPEADQTTRKRSSPTLKADTPLDLIWKNLHHLIKITSQSHTSRSRSRKNWHHSRSTFDPLYQNLIPKFDQSQTSRSINFWLIYDQSYTTVWSIFNWFLMKLSSSDGYWTTFYPFWLKLQC